MDPKFMREAVAEAIRGMNSGDGGPFGAVIVKDGKIVAQGHNQVLKDKDPTAHAEVTVIRKACAAIDDFELTGCQLYTSCYPCPMCLGASLWARLDTVYFAAKEAVSAGFDDQAFYEYINKPDDSVCKLQHLEVEGFDEPFKQWNLMAQKTRY